MEQLVIFNYHANVAKTDHALYAQKFRSGRNANLIMVISVEKELLNNFLNWIFLRPKKYNAANRSFILDFIARFAKVKKLINAAAFDLILRIMKI